MIMLPPHCDMHFATRRDGISGLAEKGVTKKMAIRLCPKCKRFTAFASCTQCGGATVVYGEEGKG